ncbi:anamorsin like protein, partial [Quercus suber]
QLPVGSSSFETVICICISVEFPTDRIFLQTTSALEHKLLLVGFLEVGVLKSTVPLEVQSFGVSFCL